VGNRQGHIKTAHEGIIVKYPCDEEGCGRTFWHKHLLRKHQQTHAREQNPSEEVEEKEIQHNKKRRTDFFGTFVGEQQHGTNNIFEQYLEIEETEHPMRELLLDDLETVC